MIFIIVPCISIILFACLIQLKLVNKVEEKENQIKFQSNYERYKYYSDVV
jgi:hypothetical protein